MDENSDGTYEPVMDQEAPNIYPSERLSAIILEEMSKIQKHQLEEVVETMIAKEEHEEIELEEDEVVAKALEQLNRDIHEGKQDMPNLPRSLKQAVEDERFGYFWKHAAKSQYKDILSKHTWKLRKRDRGRMKNIMRSVWAFDIRTKNVKGKTIITKFKARICADGSTQKEGIDYTKSFSPVIKYESIRLLLAIAATERYHVHQFDAVAAYLNANLEEDVYMELPQAHQGVPHSHDRRDMVVQLLKSLYGMKQSGLNWYNTLSTYLVEEMGFTKSRAEPCVYRHQKLDIIIGIYVDDIILLHRSEEDREWFFKTLHSKFKLEDRGALEVLLGMEIQQNKDFSVEIRMTKYTRELLDKFGLKNCIPEDTPLAIGTKLTKNAEQNAEWQKRTPYRECAGALLFLMVTCRPTIAHAISLCCRFMSDYNNSHWSALKHILRYLKKEIDTPLVFKCKNENEGVVTFSDSSFADTEERKSTGGYITFYRGCPISWKSKKLGDMAMSTTAAEYMQLAEASRNTMWVLMFLKELGLGRNITPTIYEDNQAAIHIADKDGNSDRTKHIDVRFHYIRDLISKNKVRVLHCSTKIQIADHLTKQQDKQTSLRMEKQLMGIEPFATPHKEKELQLPQ